MNNTNTYVSTFKSNLKFNRDLKVAEFIRINEAYNGFNFKISTADYLTLIPNASEFNVVGFVADLNDLRLWIEDEFDNLTLTGEIVEFLHFPYNTQSQGLKIIMEISKIQFNDQQKLTRSFFSKTLGPITLTEYLDV